MMRMSGADHVDSFAAATQDSNENLNHESSDGSNDVDELNKKDGSTDDGSVIDCSILGKSIGIDDNEKNNAHSSTNTIDEDKPPSDLDPLREGDLMAMIQSYPEDNDNQVENPNPGANEETNDFSASYSGTTVVMDSTPTGNNGDSDCDHVPLASQTMGKNKSKKIDKTNSSSVRENGAPSWLGPVKHAGVIKTSIPSAAKVSDGDGGLHLVRAAASREGGEQQEFGGEGRATLFANSTTQLIPEISSKLDEKLDSTRLLAKRLLQEMTVYVQSLGAIASDYGRVREFEVRESERLDAVEPQVNGARGMLLTSSVGSDSGAFFEINKANKNANPTQHQQQTKQQLVPSQPAGNRFPQQHRPSSSPNEESRPVRPRRNRTLTPIVNNRLRSSRNRVAKRNRSKKRVSFT